MCQINFSRRTLLPEQADSLNTLKVQKTPKLLLNTIYTKTRVRVFYSCKDLILGQLNAGREEGKERERHCFWKIAKNRWRKLGKEEEGAPPLSEEKERRLQGRRSQKQRRTKVRSERSSRMNSKRVGRTVSREEKQVSDGKPKLLLDFYKKIQPFKTITV